MPLGHGHHGHSSRPATPSKHPTLITVVESSSNRQLSKVDASAEEVVVSELKGGYTVGLSAQPELAETALVITQRGANIHIAFYDAALETAARKKPAAQVEIAFSDLKTLFHDYRLIKDSYYAAIRFGDPRKIQATDIGRREVHDRGGNKVAVLLRPHGIEMDLQTSRRIFSLLSLRFG